VFDKLRLQVLDRLMPLNLVKEGLILWWARSLARLA